MELSNTNKKLILGGLGLFCLGLLVGSFGNNRLIPGISSQYLNDPGLTCTRECYLTSRGSFTVPGEESCPNEPVCGNGAVEGSETCDDGNTNSYDGCSSSCSPDTMMMVTSYCGNSMCDSGEDCNSCSSDCGTCYSAAPTNYSYCYDSSACNAWQWVENGTCDYSCRNTTPDVITCTVENDTFIFQHSNGSTDFSNSVVSLGGTDNQFTKYDIEYSENQFIFKADVYIDGNPVQCPPIITPNDGESGALESCDIMKQNLQEEGEDTSGMTCTGQYSFRVEKANN